MNTQESLSTNSIIVRSTGILSNKVDSETILLGMEKSRYYGMVSTGSRIWDLLSSPISIGRIIDILVQEYDIEREQCMAEVVSFLAELLSEHLIDVK
jgi:hypothetical protein